MCLAAWLLTYIYKPDADAPATAKSWSAVAPPPAVGATGWDVCPLDDGSELSWPDMADVDAKTELAKVWVTDGRSPRSLVLALEVCVLANGAVAPRLTTEQCRPLAKKI